LKYFWSVIGSKSREERMRAKVGPGLALGGMRHLREFKIWRCSSDVYYWIDSHTTMVDWRLTSHSGGRVGGNLATKGAERERGGKIRRERGAVCEKLKGRRAEQSRAEHSIA
jgi:hypothetical protein